MPEIWIRNEGPGNCPICGMTLEPLTATAEVEDDSEYKSMLNRFWVCGALSIPLLFLTMGGRSLLGTGPWFSRLIWVEFLLATLIVFWGAWPFFKKFWQSLIHRSPNMFTLIGLGVAVAYIYSLVAVIVTLVLLGQVLELKARGQTSAAIKSLLGLQPKTAHRIGANSCWSSLSILRHAFKPDDSGIRNESKLCVGDN